MEFICNLIFSPIFWLLLVKLFEGLQKKAALFLGSLLLASIAVLLGWILLVNANQQDWENAIGPAITNIPIIFIVVLFSTFFGVSYFQDRRKKHHFQDQFIIANDLIRGRKYQEAMDILAAIDDPEAREWEAKVRQKTLHDPDFLRQLK